ncbi:bifunctional 2-C-methyl-D-erythritol 4-phosphate cytidylyltransferase/2-C-methyl-D-erythritol 2,4-cyclodiphosphate synthase [Beijerinckia indica]|uniref:Bifunctional enzyme IspD/IspF n=1 Tax=Beijerinckia indica subsp. indica (strain ATCC 9039 / DSM 1715 / NCIMB 8712) TaxID=395963 RepID=B2IB65_BEII9|nr:bifunctional 2-C-methyl-D-erythritol 4-phosphate cytidylyltransferase/2-C-methyl-D-erythritol 2,4-cyclodiphosphate synthase [Beijerinckia indica]ACB95149.1 2C-methyl-D-erythritol 2,4-cyclodiphosphate synthase [Beijerinckia indica subsp. indica ATCC 9039]
MHRNNEVAVLDVAILVVAAGRGVRAGGGLPKQYREVAGRSVLAHTIQALAEALPEALILPVIHADDEALFAAARAEVANVDSRQLAAPVFGGATRQQSVKAGLEALAARDKAPDIVLIHDAARPFSSPALIRRAVEAAQSRGAAIPGVPLTDTVKQIDLQGEDDSLIIATPARQSLRAVQTPQAFRFDLILSGHRQAAEAGADDLTDDAAIIEWMGQQVHIFEGDPDNMKITTPQDFVAAEARLLRDLPDIRTGQGYDVHALGAGDHVWLGGVKIPHDRGLIGHSDADVLSHAITDALFGALAEGDIGSHFPPSDPQWKGADSAIFLREAANRVRERGGMIAHIDATVVCERPKVGPHRDAIRERLAEITGCPIGRVAVKATTSEKLGFTGREEGIAALALATVRLPL